MLFSLCYIFAASQGRLFVFFHYMWLLPYLPSSFLSYPFHLTRRLDSEVAVGFVLASPGPIMLHPKAHMFAHFSHTSSGVIFIFIFSSFVFVCRMIPFVCLPVLDLTTALYYHNP